MRPESDLASKRQYLRPIATPAQSELREFEAVISPYGRGCEGDCASGRLDVSEETGPNAPAQATRAAR